jgi:hypothetical protein
MLDDLVVAVESETQVVDIGRVSGFMQKVKSSQHDRGIVVDVPLHFQVRDGVI